MECGNIFPGRENRIFCSIGCKAEHNNRKARRRKEKFSEIELILHRSFEALESLFSRHPDELYTQKELSEAGYDFRYCTHLVHNANRITGWGCYTFLILQKDDFFQINAN